MGKSCRIHAFEQRSPTTHKPLQDSGNSFAKAVSKAAGHEFNSVLGLKTLQYFCFSVNLFSDADSLNDQRHRLYLSASPPGSGARPLATPPLRPRTARRTTGEVEMQSALFLYSIRHEFQSWLRYVHAKIPPCYA